MNDTSPKIAAMVAERHRRMTPLERMKIASDMFDTARAIVESSLPATVAPGTPAGVGEAAVRERASGSRPGRVC